jgi:hypothetical protein
MDRGEKRLRDNPVTKADAPGRGLNAPKNTVEYGTADFNRRKAAYRARAGSKPNQVAGRLMRTALMSKGYPGEWRIPSQDYRVGINPYRPNPISPLSMLTGSRMAASAIMGAQGRNMSVLERRKRTKEARKLAYQLAQAGGLVYRPAGAAGVFGL